MKKLIYLFCAAILLASCNIQEKEPTYVLNVSIDTLIDGNVYLQKRVDGEWVKVDTALFADGAYVMEGPASYPEMHYIFVESLKKNVPLFLDEGTISVNIVHDDSDGTSVTGSVAHDQYTKFQDGMKSFEEKMKDVYDAYRAARDAGTDAEKDSLEKVLDALYEEQQAYIKDYVFENNTDVVAPYIAYRNSYSWTVEELENIVNNFDTTLYAAPDYKILTDRITILKRVNIGQPLVDFSMKDTNDVDVTLSEISKGKYMLVDFWASWCGPCRAENPNIVACYNDFHDKGFDVLGVSFDNSREKWIKAIHDDELYWNHVSDLAYWNNAAGKLYGVRSIPSSVLLDPDGIIIAKNLRGEDLRNKLEELMP